MSNTGLHESASGGGGSARSPTPELLVRIPSTEVPPSSPGQMERGGGDLHTRKSKRNSGDSGTSTPVSTTSPRAQIKHKSSSLTSSSQTQHQHQPTTAAENHNSLIKYGSLLLLVGQMVGLVLLMRYSRTHSDGELYLASTAVFMMEVSHCK